MEKKANLLKFLLSTTILLLLVYLLYVPGLSGPFLFDDFPNLEPLGYFGGVTDSQSAMRFIFGNNSGPTGRPVSMASFLLNDTSWPSIPFYFKQTNLFLHLACGLLALLVLNRLLVEGGAREEAPRSYWFCFVVVAIWLLHPINLSTVLYAIQRMAILSAFFSMASLYCYLLFRGQGSGTKRLRQFSLLTLSFIFIVLGAYSKENAILLIPFILFLEVFYFDKSVFPKIRRVLKKNWMLVLLGLASVLYFSSGWWGQGYERRDFSLYERITYQLPVMGDYVFKIVFPQVSEFNLFNGEYATIKDKAFSGIEILKAAIIVVLFVVLVASIRWKLKVVSLGLSWFFIFHLLESTFYPLEIYFEHRNYLPSIGLIVVIVAGANALMAKVESNGFLKKGVFVAVVLYLSVSLFILSLTWARSDTLFLKWEMDEPESARAKVVYASIVEQQTFPENAIEHIDRAINLKPSAIGLHLRKIRLICEHELDYELGSAIEDLFHADQFDMGVVAAMEDLIVLDEDGDGYICGNSGYSVSLTDLFSHVESANSVAWNATRAARYYSLKSDYFARQGNLDASVKSLDRAILFTPTVDIYLKKAVMLASAGLDVAALDALESAERADEARPMFYPSRIEEIRELRRRIKNQSEASLKNGAFSNE